MEGRLEFRHALLRCTQIFKLFMTLFQAEAVLSIRDSLRPLFGVQ